MNLVKGGKKALLVMASLAFLSSVNLYAKDFKPVIVIHGGTSGLGLTKEEFAKDGLIYKTNRKYWRMVNGVKNYYCGENESGYVIWKDLDTLKKDIKAEAESNRVISSSITDELIHMKEAEARLKFGCVTTTGASTVVTDNK